MIGGVKRKPVSNVFEFCVANLGVMKGARLAGFIACWAIAEASYDHPLGEGEGTTAAVREFCEYWNESERTAYRRVAEFHALFPHWATPGPLCAIARAKQVEAAAVGSLPASALAIA